MSLEVIPCQGTVKASAPQAPGYVPWFSASTRDIRERQQAQKPLIFMRFHGVFLGSQHEIRSKQHNGKVSRVPPRPGALGDSYSPQVISL